MRQEQHRTKECHLNNLLIFETANEREYSLISKFAFISVHSRFVIWASYLSENPKNSCTREMFDRVIH